MKAQKLLATFAEMPQASFVDFATRAINEWDHVAVEADVVGGGLVNDLQTVADALVEWRESDLSAFTGSAGVAIVHALRIAVISIASSLQARHAELRYRDDVDEVVVKAEKLAARGF